MEPNDPVCQTTRRPPFTGGASTCRLKFATGATSVAICFFCLSWDWEFGRERLSSSAKEDSLAGLTSKTAALSQNLALDTKGVVLQSPRQRRDIGSELHSAGSEKPKQKGSDPQFFNGRLSLPIDQQLRQIEAFSAARAALGSLQHQLADSAAKTPASVRLSDAQQSVYRLKSELRDLQAIEPHTQGSPVSDVVQAVADALSSEKSRGMHGELSSPLSAQEWTIKQAHRRAKTSPQGEDVGNAIATLFVDSRQPEPQNITRFSEQDVHDQISGVFSGHQESPDNTTGPILAGKEDRQRIQDAEIDAKKLNSNIAKSSYIGRPSPAVDAVSVFKTLPVSSYDGQSGVVVHSGPMPANESVVIRFRAGTPAATDATKRVREGATRLRNGLKGKITSNDEARSSVTAADIPLNTVTRTPQLAHNQDSDRGAKQPSTGPTHWGDVESSGGCGCCKGSSKCSCCEQGWLSLQIFGKWLLMVLALILCVITFLIFGFMCFGCLWAWREFKRQDRWEKFLDGTTSKHEGKAQVSQGNRNQSELASKPQAQADSTGARPAAVGQGSRAGGSSSGRPISKRADSQIAR